MTATSTVPPHDPSLEAHHGPLLSAAQSSSNSNAGGPFHDRHNNCPHDPSLGAHHGPLLPSFLHLLAFARMHCSSVCIFKFLSVLNFVQKLIHPLCLSIGTRVIQAKIGLDKLGCYPGPISIPASNQSVAAVW